jgi:hypothetical protein
MDYQTTARVVSRQIYDDPLCLEVTGYFGFEQNWQPKIL